MAIVSEPTPMTPLLPKSSSFPSGDHPSNANILLPSSSTPVVMPDGGLHKPLAVLAGHVGTVSCLALCGEFVLSASRGRDIIAWQQPDLRFFARFGHGDDGSVKALVAVGSRVFTAHQDGRVRVWAVSRSSENVFRLAASLPTTKDYLGKFMRQSNYVRTRRHHRRLWIEHADSISCLAVNNGLIYSGSWDKHLKVWRVSDLKCLESIKAHDDAINALVAHKSVLYSASADGKIKVWSKRERSTAKNKYSMHSLLSVLEGHNKDVSWNAVIVCEDGGKFVYAGGSDGRIMGWESCSDHQDWRLICDVRAHGMSVLCMCSMGELVCSGSADKSIGVWKRDHEGSGGLWRVGVIRGHEGPVKCLQSSGCGVGGGHLLYSGGLDKSLRVWWVPKEYSTDQVEKEVVKDHGKDMDKCIML